MDAKGESTLMLSLVDGPDWLQINNMGNFTNKAGMKPERGVYGITVMGTNENGATATLPTFWLAVALSDPGDEDNDRPSIRVQEKMDYVEGSAAMDKVKVATIAVQDDDFDIAPHPYGQVVLILRSVSVKYDEGDPKDVTDRFMGEKSGMPSADGVQLYDIYLKAGEDDGVGATSFDYDLGVRELVFEVRAINRGTQGANRVDSETFTIDVEDANEAPILNLMPLDRDNPAQMLRVSKMPDSSTASMTVEQEEAMPRMLYLNLSTAWRDRDMGDSSDELTFGVESDSDWIMVKYAPMKYEDFMMMDTDDKAEGVQAPMWGGTNRPDKDDMIAVVEIDRKMHISDAMTGKITLTATDEGGAQGMGAVSVEVTDENVDIPASAKPVTIMGMSKQGETLTMSFDYTMDPDLMDDGDMPTMVVYTWIGMMAGSTEEKVLGSSVGEPEPLMLTQNHVDMTIKAHVEYYEKHMGLYQRSSASASSKPVANMEDEGMAYISYRTTFNERTGAKFVKADVVIMDKDGVPDEVEYTWEVSDNGVGGWVDATDVNEDDLKVPSVGEAKYYRVTVTYTDKQGDLEIIVGSPEQFGMVSAPSMTPMIVSSNENRWVVGATLTVEKVGGGSVQWQMQNEHGVWMDIGGATSADMELTSSYAGAKLRALVTHTDADGLVTSRVPAMYASMEYGMVDPLAAPTNNAPVATQSMYVVKADEAKMGKAYVETMADATIDLSSMFYDADGDKLEYSVHVERKDFGLDDAPMDDYLYLYVHGNRKTKTLASIDTDSGHLTYSSIVPVTMGSLGEEMDSMGISLNVKATDMAGESDMVEVIVDVAPVGVEVDMPTGLMLTPGQDAGGLEVRRVATLDVQDQNSTENEAGQYMFEVDNAKFEVVANVNDMSVAFVRVKKDAQFTAADADAKGMITVTVTATQVNGNHMITKEIMVKLNLPDAEGGSGGMSTGDPEHGLTDDDGGADENDGPVMPEPMPGGMGLVRGDLHNFEIVDNDLFDSFVIALDDSIEIG